MREADSKVGNILTARTFNALANLGLLDRHISALGDYTENQYRGLKNMGSVSLANLREFMKRYRIPFKGHSHDTEEDDSLYWPG